jgi:hypothetical protein
MPTDSRLPVFAHWQGREIIVDLPDNQPDPEIGSIIHLTVEVDGELQRRPFKVTDKHQRPANGSGTGLLSRLGLGGSFFPEAIDIDVTPHEPEH